MNEDAIKLTQTTREIIAILNAHFNGLDGAFEWLKATNPMLGNVSGVDMIRMGQEEKLLKTIKNLLAGNVA